MNQLPSDESLDKESAPPSLCRLYIPDDPEVRRVTWQRTTEMYGTIELDLDATWEQVQDALADGRYYSNDEDGPIHVYDEKLPRPLAVIYPMDSQQNEDEGGPVHTDDAFVLGEEIV